MLEEARCSASRVLVKDNTDVKGMHTAADRPASADNLAERDAPAFRSLRRAGALILGKANMTEFANIRRRKYRTVSARAAGRFTVRMEQGTKRLQYGVRGCCSAGFARRQSTDTSFFCGRLCGGKAHGLLSFPGAALCHCIAAGQCRAAGAHLCGCGLVYSAMRAEALEPLYAPEARTAAFGGQHLLGGNGS